MPLGCGNAPSSRDALVDRPIGRQNDAIVDRCVTVSEDGFGLVLYGGGVGDRVANDVVPHHQPNHQPILCFAPLVSVNGSVVMKA